MKSPNKFSVNSLALLLIKIRGEFEKQFDCSNPTIDQKFEEYIPKFVDNYMEERFNYKYKKDESTNLRAISEKEAICLLKNDIFDSFQHTNRTFVFSRFLVKAIYISIFAYHSGYYWSNNVKEYAANYILDNVGYLKEEIYVLIKDVQLAYYKDKEITLQRYKNRDATIPLSEEEREWVERYSVENWEQMFNEDRKKESGIDFDRVKIDWIRAKSPEEQIKYFGGGRAGTIRKALFDSNVISTDKDLEMLYKTNDKGRKVFIPLKELNESLPNKALKVLSEYL